MYLSKILSDRLIQYSKEHWENILFSGSGGVVLTLLFARWLFARTWIRGFLATEDMIVLAGIFVGFALILISIFFRVVDFWDRYRRTYTMLQPPFLVPDLVATGLASAALTIYLLRNRFFYQVHLSEEIKFFLLSFGLLLALWLICSYKWPLRRDSKSAVNILPRIAGGDYSDEAIIDESQDMLSRREFVDRLYEQIKELSLHDSFVFALNAGWGEGKTSVLNLLGRRLIGNPKLITVKFNPWFFATELALIENFYSNIEQTLKRRYLLSGVRRVIQKYRDLLTFGLRSAGFQIKLPIQNDPEIIRADLESWIARTGSRLIILIDDIDRLQRTEMLAVFKLTRLATRLKNTVFMLSFDEVVVRRTLKETENVDPEFLEKIVQKQIQLPAVDRMDLDRFLLFSDPEGGGGHRSAIDLLFDELKIDPRIREEFDKNIVPFYHRHLTSLFRTIRQAKRFMNGLRATFPPIKVEVNLYDFFLLEVIRVFFSEVYRDIWTSRWFYVPDWTDEARMRSPFVFSLEDNKDFDVIREHIEYVLKNLPHRKVAQALLEEIFFVRVKNAFSPTTIESDKVSGSMQDRYLANKRITHPDCFPKYFLFRVPVEEIADRVVEGMIREWNESKLEEVETLALANLRSFKEAGRLIRLFRKLAVYISSIDVKRVKGITRALYKIAAELSSERVALWTNELTLAESLFLRLIVERADPNEISPLIRDTVQNSPSIPFITLIVLDCHRDRGDFLRTIVEKVELSEMRRLAKKRFHRDYNLEKRDIFSDLPRDFNFVLSMWSTNWETDLAGDKREVQPYLLRLFDEKPEYIGTFLSKNVEHKFPGEEFYFNFERFVWIIDLEVVAELLKKYKNQALEGEQEKKAAELFLQGYKAYQQKQEKEKKEKKEKE